MDINKGKRALMSSVKLNNFVHTRHGCNIFNNTICTCKMNYKFMIVLIAIAMIGEVLSQHGHHHHHHDDYHDYDHHHHHGHHDYHHDDYHHHHDHGHHDDYHHHHHDDYHDHGHHNHGGFRGPFAGLGGPFGGLGAFGGDIRRPSGLLGGILGRR